MSRDSDTFSARVSRILRHRQKLEAGFALKLDENNLIVPRPRYVRLRFPWRGLAMAALVALALKAWIMVALDPQGYDARLARLEAGHPVERIGAFVMQPDPASDALAQAMRMLRG